jgi:hypothetical protein
VNNSIRAQGAGECVATLAPMRITGATARQTCAICERSLLTGERAVRFAPHHGAALVDVCPLCVEEAIEHGWIREGSPATPTVPDRRRRRGGLARLLDLGGRSIPAPVIAQPVLRRLSESEQAIVEAAELFNGSDHRRAVAGIARSLGPPKVSIVPLSGATRELVVTVAWEISWYQYRVAPDSAQPVRLAERGQDAGELDRRYTAWNAQLEDDGRVSPEIARV